MVYLAVIVGTNIGTFIMGTLQSFFIKWISKIIQILLVLYFGVRLQYYAKLNNPGMYKVHRLSTCAYILGTVLWLIVQFLIDFNTWYYSVNGNNFQKKPDRMYRVVNRENTNILGLYWGCEVSKQCHDSSALITSVQTILAYDLHLGDLFTAAIILFVKRKDDLLVSFNRLGDLVKISIFQKFKDAEMRQI